ncbi:unnamed protein product, partial [Allacma fusca]
MLDNPRAKLFQFQDHWGEFEHYRYSRMVPKFEYKGNRKINLSDVLERRRKTSKLQGNVTQSFRLSDRIQEMIENPMVRLFNGENLTGNYVDHSRQKSQSIKYK